MQASGAAGHRGVVIDDVVKQAGVSRGAFYRHFASLDDALAALVGDLVGDIIADADRLFGDVEDPVLGTALGCELLLFRAAASAPWARFVAGTNLLLADPSLTAVLRRAVAAGLARGLLRFRSLTAATDVLSGGLLSAIRRLADGMADSDAYVEEVAEHLLRSVGARAVVAAQAARAARRRIAAGAPGAVPWWPAPG